MKKRRSAYDLPFRKVELTADEQRRALLWWQRGDIYHHLACPVCAARLDVAPDRPTLICPTLWCGFELKEIPWGVYSAWQQIHGT